MEEIKRTLQESGVTVLSNEFVPLTRNGDSIVLAGIDDPNGYADQETPQQLAQVVDTTLTLFPSFTSGFYHCTDENCEGAMVFVNRGLGNSPKIVPRILNRPQVAVITLERG